jgi:hypothetical protein
MHLRIDHTTETHMKVTKSDLQNTIADLTQRLAAANKDIAFLRGKLNEADIRAKRLIAASNRRIGNPERRAALEAARARAMATGTVVKA